MDKLLMLNILLSQFNYGYNSEYKNLSDEEKKYIDYVDECLKETDVKNDKEYLKEEVASEAKYLLNDLTMPARRKAREEFDKKMRDTPLGKIEQISNTASVFRRIFKK